jgi:D-alanyl-D-alanine carboxypeptidase/D-alanyl-D-alanine-endopeptidase (penicillin-binding protein 4)
VLVGGGDVTLSRTPSGTETVYPGAAHLDDLAAQVRTAWNSDPSNPPLRKLVLDASLFGGDEWEPSWDLVEREFGYMSNITALMVDGDRDDPRAETSFRSADPIGRAGDAFASALGGISVIERGTAPADAQKLGEVLSPTVAQLVDKALVVSDNTVAEMLARLVAIETGAGNTFGAINQGVLEGLSAYGVDTTGITVVDGSGLSDDNAVPPSYLTQLFVKINAREASLGVIMDGLPVSGQRGSLSYSDRSPTVPSRRRPAGSRPGTRSRASCVRRTARHSRSRSTPSATCPTTRSRRSTRSPPASSSAATTSRTDDRRGIGGGLRTGRAADAT